MAKIKILVVEDESLVAATSTTCSGVSAIRSSGSSRPARTPSVSPSRPRPEIVLMDIVLKGEIDGIMAAERIWENFGIPVVYLTAYADETHAPAGQGHRTVRLYPEAVRRARTADHDRDGVLQSQDGQAPSRTGGMAGHDPGKHRRRRHRQRRRRPRLVHESSGREAHGLGADRRSSASLSEQFFRSRPKPRPGTSTTRGFIPCRESSGRKPGSPSRSSRARRPSVAERTGPRETS